MLCAALLMTLPTFSALARPGGGGTRSGGGSRAVSASTQPAGTREHQPAHDGSHLSATQQQNVQKLQTDLGSIKAGSEVTQAQKDALKNDLTSMAQGATKPDPALVQQLSTDLSSAFSDKSISKQEQVKLTQDLSAVLNSANISPAQVQHTITDAQSILTASGVNQATVQMVGNDLKAIATEAQKNVGNATGTAPTGGTVQQKLQSRKGQAPRP